MTMLDALRGFIQEVEEGRFPAGADGAARRVWPYHMDASKDFGLMAHEAFAGSLDAAEALHRAELPAWGYTISDRGADRIAKVWRMRDTSLVWVSVGENAARAWLASILKAKLEMTSQPPQSMPNNGE